MIKLTKTDGETRASLKDLRPWKDNPRDVTKEDLERLRQQMALGEHSALLITEDGEILGGNTRFKVYTDDHKPDAWVAVLSLKKTKDGAYHAFINGKQAKYSDSYKDPELRGKPRVFDTVGQAKLEYALSHNDLTGTTNEVKLAELLDLYPIPAEMFKVSTALRPIEDVAFEHGPGSDDPNARPQDMDTTGTDKLDTFMNGAIKQIVLYFDNEQYENVVPRIEKLRERLSAPSNTEMFMTMLEFTENNFSE